jgi:hypothetical protein
MQKFKEQPRLESITVSFHQGGCGVDGAHYRRRPSFQPCLAFPSPRPPDMQQAKRWPARLLYSCHKERTPFD